MIESIFPEHARSLTSDVQDGETEIYLQEAAYYLKRKGLSFEELSRILEIPEGKVRDFYDQYESKIQDRTVLESDVDRNLWEDVYNDSIGNEKITFARDNGFYHCRKSDLEQMESPALMAIFETSKQFLDLDMYRKYLDTKPPVGYDPMALQRQVKRAVDIIREILEARWEKTGAESASDNLDRK